MPRIGTSTSAIVCAARRNVPSPPSTTRMSVRRSSSSVSAVSPAGDGPLLHAVHPAPAGGALAELEGVLARGVVREPDPAHGHSAPSQAASTASSIRASISAQPGPAWRWAMNSRLPSGPWIGDAIDGAHPEPEGRGTLDGLAQDAAVDPAVAHDAALARPPCRPRTGA